MSAGPFTFVIALLAVTLVNADLPIHCIHSQVVGEWKFEVSQLKPEKEKECGFHHPDQNVLHFNGQNHFEFDISKTHKVHLKSPDSAVSDDGTKGSWTMVYDEGFETKLNGLTFFAFMRYYPKKQTHWMFSDHVDDYVSDCDRTMTGWYHTADKKQWGCFRAYKSSVQPTSFNIVPGKPTGNSEVRSVHYDAPVVSPFSFAELESKITVRRPSHDYIDLDNTFEPDYEFVDSVNKDESSTWQAAVHEQFIGKKMKEMLKMLGGHRKFSKPHFRFAELNRHHHSARKHLKGRARALALHRLSQSATESSELPENWDWRSVDLGSGVENFDSPVRNQRSCGSCYALASVYAMESRVRIATKNRRKPELSPQHVLACSRTNQGCEGGYPFLVGKFGEEFGLVEESELSYEANDFVKCESLSANAKRYYLKGYQYIGGYYGGCSERSMMDEIHRNGPVMVAFQAPSNLFYYRNGVFTCSSSPKSEPQRADIPNIEAVRPWEQTNHAVVAVGWGVAEDGMKYWVLKNTWGPHWGENGYFRIRRGENDCGIESMAVSALIDLELSEL